MNRYILPKSNLVISLCISLFGLIIFILGLALLIKGIAITNNSYELEAKVTNVIDDGNERAIWIEYEVDSVIYNDTLPYWNAELDIGDSTIIYVDNDDPTIFHGSKNGYLVSSLILLVCGIFAFLYKGSVILFYIKERQRIKELMTNGTKIEAKVICVEENTKAYSFGVNPKIITCEYIKDEESYIFVSKDIWVDYDISSFVDKKIDVYTNGDYNYFYIDYLSVK